MNAKNNILNKIRAARQSAQALSGAVANVDQESTASRAAAQAQIALHEWGPQPSIAREDPLLRFTSECARLLTTLTRVATLADAPGAIAQYLAGLQLTAQIVGWPEFAELNWAAAQLTYTARPAVDGDAIGLTGAFCAIGETGTLLLLSSPSMPKTPALLPETHIAIVQRSRIVATMEESFALLRTEVGEPPRAATFISGPSRTADIEQTIVIGAHGPYRVHVILVG